MSFTLWSLRIGGSAVLLVLCLLSACAPKPIRLPSLPQPSRVPQGDLARDAQSFLLQEAHRAFKEERYPAAALFFKRFVDIAQDSPRLAEARLWLGHAYEQLGDFRAAMAQYRLVAAGSLSRQADGTLYESYALRRLDELYSAQVAPDHRHAARLALRVRVDQLPPMTSLVPWFQELANAGVAAVAIAPALPGHAGFGLEMVRAIAAEAHRFGVLLWVTLDLHQGLGMDVRPEWTATIRHGDWYEGASTARADVANPAYQSHLEEMIRMFARTECDGVLLAARSAPGFAKEFSADSLRAFAASFGSMVSPEEIFGMGSVTEAAGQARPAQYWRWAGWKARSYGQLIARLRTVLREYKHTATLSVEVHQSTLTAPLRGLEEFGEDVAELTLKTGGSIVVRREGAGGAAVFEQLERQAGAPDRVWLGVAVKAGTDLPSAGDLKISIGDLDEYGRWNMVVEVESVQAVP